MKKILSLSLALTIALSIFAQCNPEEVGKTPTSYKKAYTSNYIPTKDEEKWMTNLFTAVVEPALKSTKGLRGTWNPQSKYINNKERPVVFTKEGLDASTIEMYMNLLGCSSKTNTLYEKHESGLVLNFCINSLWPISEESRHDEYKMVKGKSTKVFIYDAIDGRQIYSLKEQAEINTGNKYAVYVKDDYGKYFVISKPDVSFFIPLTLKQVLEINKKNGLSRIVYLKERLKIPELKDQNKFDQDEILAETKSVQLINDYISSSAKELAQPFKGSTFFTEFFKSTDELNTFINRKENTHTEKLVTLNPDYFNRTISKSAPQFISVELRTQGNSPTTLKAFNDFEKNLDLEKLQQILVK